MVEWLMATDTPNIVMVLLVFIYIMYCLYLCTHRGKG